MKGAHNPALLFVLKSHEKHSNAIKTLKNNDMKNEKCMIRMI